jgi:hypothetical protein
MQQPWVIVKWWPTFWRVARKQAIPLFTQQRLLLKQSEKVMLTLYEFFISGWGKTAYGKH